MYLTSTKKGVELYKLKLLCMKKLLYFLMVGAVGLSCVSERQMELAERKLYIGEDKNTGSLAIGIYRFTGSKEMMEYIRPGKIYKPSFSVPDDIVLIIQNEVYRYLPTNGIAVYKQEKKSRTWAKVSFFPLSHKIEGIVCDDLVRITVRPLPHKEPIVLRYRWRPERSNFVGRWVRV
jgi:hypothetical protein